MAVANYTMDTGGDHHIHTRFCNHASGEMEEYVQAAISLGLHSMTFLEHLECGIENNHRTWLTEELFEEYFQEGERLKNCYRDKIDIRLGAEVGYNPTAVAHLQGMLNQFPFEHIGLSYHFYFDGRQHLNMVSRRSENIMALQAIGTDKILTTYFNGLIQACDTLQCDKICHLDAVLRHVPCLSFSQHHDQLIEQLLQIMREKQIALEVNTSGVAIRNLSYPSPHIIERSRTLSIPLIAGSDAHCPEQVGRYFNRLI